MTTLSKLATARKCPSLILACAFLVVAGVLLFLSNLRAGTGGVDGGCAYLNTTTKKWESCTGLLLPMWYPVTQNPTYNEGDLPCGWYGNQDCGMTTGDILSE